MSDKRGEWRLKNKEKLSQQGKEYYLKNKKSISEKNKKYYYKNRKKVLEKSKKWGKKYRLENKEKLKKRNREHYLKSREKLILKRKKYASKNREEINRMSKEYYQKNKEEVARKNKQNRKKIRKYQKDYKRKRYNNDEEYRIKDRLKWRIRIAFNQYTKTGKIMKSRDYGIDYKTIIEYLKPFPKNLSEYHIDHIKPLCSFIFINPNGSTNLEEIKKAFAPKNHQWLTSKENMIKGSKLN